MQGSTYVKAHIVATKAPAHARQVWRLLHLKLSGTLFDPKHSSMDDTRDIKQRRLQYCALERHRQYHTLYSHLLIQSACSDHSYLVLVGKASTYEWIPPIYSPQTSSAQVTLYS